MAVCPFDPSDSKWDLLKKILQNQTSLSSDLATQSANLDSRLTQIFDRMFQFMEAMKPVNTLQTLADVTVVSGTAVQCPAANCKKGVLISAHQNNSGFVYVGDASVTNLTGAKSGIEVLMAGMSTWLPVANANMVYINGDNSGDKVGVTAI